MKKKKEARKPDWTESSGNVFKDIGFSDEEAEGLHLHSSLMIEIKKYIGKNKLTQVKAAQVFGVTQPRISDLMRGKFEVFTVNSLLAMLARAGVPVELKVATSFRATSLRANQSIRECTATSE